MLPEGYESLLNMEVYNEEIHGFFKYVKPTFCLNSRKKEIIQ